MSEVTTITLEVAVQAGAELLDETIPKWRRLIDLDTFNMALHGGCLLSQIFGTFQTGIQLLDLGDIFFGEPVQDSDGWEHGFTLSPYTDPKDVENQYAKLTTLWKQIIQPVSASVPGLDSIIAYFRKQLENRGGEWIISTKEICMQLFMDGFTLEQFTAVRKCSLFKFYEAGWPAGGGYQIYFNRSEGALK